MDKKTIFRLLTKNQGLKKHQMRVSGNMCVLATLNNYIISINNTE